MITGILRQVQGWVKLRGGTDGTMIGNVSDRLKVTPSNLQSTTEFAHFMNELGRCFSIDHIYTLNAGAYHQHILTTPNTDRLCYLSLFTGSSDDTQIEVYESPTATLGAAVAVVNQNRNSANANTSILNNITTLNTTGTLISQYRIGMGSGKGNNNALGAQISALILKKNTLYLLRWQSNVNGNIISSSTRFTEFDRAVDV